MTFPAENECIGKANAVTANIWFIYLFKVYSLLEMYFIFFMKPNYDHNARCDEN